MGFLGIGKSKLHSLGKKAKRMSLGASKVGVNLGKVGVIGGKIGMAPEIAALGLALGQPEVILGAKALGASGAVAVEGGRALKNVSRSGRENIRGHHNSKRDKKRLQKASKQTANAVGAAALGFG